MGLGHLVLGQGVVTKAKGGFFPPTMAELSERNVVANWQSDCRISRPGLLAALRTTHSLSRTVGEQPKKITSRLSKSTGQAANILPSVQGRRKLLMIKVAGRTQTRQGSG